MGELIGEIQLKEKRKKLITKTLQELNNILTSLPSQEISEVNTVVHPMVKCFSNTSPPFKTKDSLLIV